MKLSCGILVLLLVAVILTDVDARKGRRKPKTKSGQSRGRKNKNTVTASQIRVAPSVTEGGLRSGRATGLLSSVVGGLDDTIVINLGLGDRLLDLLNGGSDNSNADSDQPAQTPTEGTAPARRVGVPVPYSGEWIRMRATNGFMNAGIVEVYRAGRWGLVCDDKWDIKDATVACRQLGFRHGAQASPGEAYYGMEQARWHDSDILMDEVTCEGVESSLQHCQYHDRHDCTIAEAASVVCRPNSGCPDGWIGGRDSCYRFFRGANNFKSAGAMCLSLNASLVSVESMQENHFLSNVIMLSASEDEHTWYTSGRLSKNAWRWSKNVARAAKRKSQRKSKSKNKGKGKRKSKGRKNKLRGKKRRTRAAKSRSGSRRMRAVRSTVRLSRWFPGWGESMDGQEPSGKRGHTCLVLTDLYPLPNGTEVSMDYFYWKASRCKVKGGTISFICEMDSKPQPQECYTGIGADYRGMMDHTDIGTPCISWATTSINDRTHPGKGLGEHSFCRNPDSDQRPWCWVGQGKFGFCPIPLCSATTTPSTVTSTTLSVTETPNCPSDEFFCNTDNMCILGRFQCDGEEDCEGGEDEANCDYNSEKFEEYSGRIPDQPLDNLTYANVPLETCATYCLENTYFMCVSFVFNADERLCQLLNAADDASVHLLPSDTHSYYLLSTEAVNCTGKFRCSNNRCIPAEHKCDGHDDCGDLSDELHCATQPDPMIVRLVDGGENSGRVEVRYLDEWGTICDDNWDLNDAHVVCRMIGYPGAERATMLGEFGVGHGNIMLDEVQCRGDEYSLQDCPASPWKQHDCQPFEAAGVECQVAKTCEGDEFVCSGNTTMPMCVTAASVCDGTPSCPDASDEADCEVRVELVNGTTSGEGRVEIIRNGLRGTVCDDEWGDEEASVVCNMLGYRYGGEALSEAYFGQGSGLIWLDEVGCDGTESSLADCSHTGWTVHDCSPLEDASVRCFSSQPSPSPTTARITTVPPESVRVYLVNGSSPNQGRVEIEVGSFQGTICDDSFDRRDATVICRMAGFGDGGMPVANAGYGPGSERLPILLDELGCDGNETSVLECDHLKPLGSHDCRHSEDAGVFCVVPGSTQRPDVDGQGRPITVTAIPTTEDTPTGILDGVQCGLRPLDRLTRRKREAEDSTMANLTAPRELDSLRHEKIVGGDMAVHGMYPWQVGVKKIYNSYTDGTMMIGHWCGGTIINRFWVLSAAHCFKNLAKSRVLLMVGDHGRKVKDEGEQKFLVEELIMHRGYSGDNHDYDIALLKVRSDDGQGIKFNDYVQPACLPSPNAIFAAGTMCYISGWGETDTDTSPNTLRSARVPLKAFSECQNMYKWILTNRMMCAGYRAGGIDTCQGDSGGPLVCDIDGAYTLLGITSWGFGCGKPNAPGVYARVTAFLTWIEDNIQRHS